MTRDPNVDVQRPDAAKTAHFDAASDEGRRRADASRSTLRKRYLTTRIPTSASQNERICIPKHHRHTPKAARARSVAVPGSLILAAAPSEPCSAAPVARVEGLVGWLEAWDAI